MNLRIKSVLVFLLFTAIIIQFGGAVRAFTNDTDPEEIADSFSPDVLEEETFISVGKKGDVAPSQLETAVLDPADVPEAISLDEIEASDHVNRLYDQEEDLYTVLFQNRDGTKTMYTFAKPVKYIDQDGNTRDKNTKITEVSDKSEGNKFETADNDVKILFSENILNGISLQCEKMSITLTPITDSNYIMNAEKVNINNQNGKQYGEKNRNGISYSGVFGEKTALMYTPTYWGIKEDIVLSEFTGQNSFSFKLNTNGLTLTVHNDGSYTLVDPLTGKDKVYIGNIISYDSNGGFSYGELKSETIKADNEYLLTITVSEEFLKDENTAYPVYIDPTLEFSAQTEIIDSILYSGRPCNNYGSNSYLYTGYVDSTYQTGRVVVKFPCLESGLFSRLEADQIGPSYFSMYRATGGSATTVTCKYNLGTNWSENTVTWSSESMVAGSPPPGNTVGNGTYHQPSGKTTFTITNALKTWTGDKTSLRKGFVFYNATSETDGAYLKGFLSTEYSSDTPYLRITYYLPDEDGNFFLSNKRTGRYMDIDGPSMSNGALIHQWDFHGYNQEFWYFEKQSDGYYKIISKYSGKALTVANYTDPEPQIIQYTYYGYDRQKWKLIPVMAYLYDGSEYKSGYYRIVPKSHESSDKALSLSSSTENQNHTLLSLRHLTSPYDYSDEWRLEPKVRIDIQYDGGYNQRFYDISPLMRIAVCIDPIAEMYRERFGIIIVFGSPSQVQSYPEAAGCPAASYCNSHCPCGTIAECNNEEPTATTNRIHHKNAVKMLYEIQPADPTHITMLFTGHKHCKLTDGIHYYDNMGGIITMERDKIIICDLNSGLTYHEKKAATIAHEIGHIFSANDHYGFGCPSTKYYTDHGVNAERDCIYGENFGNENIYTIFKMCPFCTDWIRLNRFAVNHE